MKKKVSKRKSPKRKDISSKALVIGTIVLTVVLVALYLIYFRSGEANHINNYPLSVNQESDGLPHVMNGEQTVNNERDASTVVSSATFLSPLAQIFLIFMLVISVAFNGFYLLKRYSQSAAEKKQEENNMTITNHKHYTASLNNLGTRQAIDERDAEIRKLKAEVQRLKTEKDASIIDQQQHPVIEARSVQTDFHDNRATNPYSSVNIHQAPELAPSIPHQPVSVSTFFEGPYEDSKFSVETGSEEKKFRYLYRIECESNNSMKGKLYLEPSLVELDILRNYSDTILKPACSYLNSFYSGFGNIGVLKPGIVERMGDDWVVKEKVQIKFT